MAENTENTENTESWPNTYEKDFPEEYQEAMKYWKREDCDGHIGARYMYDDPENKDHCLHVYCANEEAPNWKDLNFCSSNWASWVYYISHKQDKQDMTIAEIQELTETMKCFFYDWAKVQKTKERESKNLSMVKGKDAASR